MIYILQLIYSSPFLAILFFVLGLCVGSFLNVLIDRLPSEESIGGRSHCDKCKKSLSPTDLVPVFSYLFLKGKCRYCKTGLSMQYPLIEILTGVTFVFTWAHIFGMGSSLIQTLGYFILLSSCIVIVVADAKYHIIPDHATLAFVMAGFMIANNHSIQTQLGGGVVLFLILMCVFLVTRGKMMGFGDVKLAFGMGILFGVHDGLVSLYLSFLTGGLFSIGLLSTGVSKLKSKIAFGPFMIIGTLLMLFMGDRINRIIDRIF